MGQAPLRPTNQITSIQLQNWRSRANVPGRMTGTFQLFFTGPNVTGSATVDGQLRNMNRQGPTAANQPRTGSDAFEQALQETANELERLRD